MKIALVSPYDFAFPGGITNHISSLEYHLTKMGHEVKIIAPASNRVTDFGDRFISIGKPRPIPASGSICRVTISPWLSSRVEHVLETEKFDIIHLHEPLMPMLCTTVLRLSGTVNVGTFHAHEGSPGYNFGRPISTIILRRWFRRLDGRIAVSVPAREFANKYMPGEYNIIPNGVDLEHFSPDKMPIDGYDDGKLNILFVGRLEHRKGVNYLLDAYRSAKMEIPDCRLIIVGPGTRLRGRYEKWVARKGLKDVEFVGRVTYDELPRYYQRADIFCAPATSCESFGIILLEAMAMGKPVIASNIAGYASVMTHNEEGLLVPPRDAKTLSQALVSLMSDSSLREQLGARGKVKAMNYNWQQVAQNICDYYIEVINSKK